MGHAITIRDPIWNTISIDATARTIVDSATFQRLRYIRQLGHAHLVYPGATHTRFDHAVGVYHLARRALSLLGERDGLAGIAPADCRIIPFAALLHDVGHYPFSHALEELESGRIPGHHEALVGRFLAETGLDAVLSDVGDDAAARIEALIRGASASPLQGLVSGSLDLDKIEYLRRDAHFCGVPYGFVDVDRLLQSLVVLRDPDTGHSELGVQEKGVAALESLLFAKYQMFRNVYWHHGVRAATVLYKRVVSVALGAGLIAADELVGATDEGLMHLLETRSIAGGGRGREGTAGQQAAGDASWVGAGVKALRERRLPKRAAELAAGELADDVDRSWLESDSALKRRVEDRMAEELALPRHAVYLDFPEKGGMFGLDLLLRRRTGGVIRLGPAGRAGLIGLPRISDELYRSARMLRLYTFGERRVVGADALGALASLPTAEVAAALDSGRPLLG